MFVCVYILHHFICKILCSHYAYATFMLSDDFIISMDGKLVHNISVFVY